MKKPPKEISYEPIFKQFCSERKLAPSSIKLYTNILQKYSDFTGKKLEQLLDEAEDEEEDNVRFRKRKINRYLNEFQQFIEELDYSHNYKTQMMSSVKAFYRHYGVQLPYTMRARSRETKHYETIDDLPTMEEIRRFLEHCSSVYRAMVVLGLSSGMGRAEIASLTFKHFYDSVPLKKYPKSLAELIEKVKDEEDLIPLWKIKRVKTGKPYFTFSTPESVERIIVYLEEINYRFPQYEPKPSDTLFRSVYKNKPLSEDSIGAMLAYINKHNGFRSVNGHYVIRCHTLRKYFATTLEKNKMGLLSTRWLLGHNIDRTTSAYIKADPEALREDYVEIAEQLITTNQDVIVLDKYKEIKHEIDEIKGELGDLVISSGRVPKAIQEYIEELEDLLGKYQNKEPSEEDTLYDDAEI